MGNGRGLSFFNPISCACSKHHTSLTLSTILKKKKEKKKEVCYPGLMFELTPQASLYIIRDEHKSWGLLWKSFQLSVWLIFPAGSLCPTEKVEAWEKTCEELQEKNIWLRNFTGFLQFPLSQLMSLDYKCISNRYPAEHLEFLCLCACVGVYEYSICVCIHVHVCVCTCVCSVFSCVCYWPCVCMSRSEADKCWFWLLISCDILFLVTGTSGQILGSPFRPLGVPCLFEPSSGYRCVVYDLRCFCRVLETQAQILTF